MVQDEWTIRSKHQAIRCLVMAVVLALLQRAPSSAAEIAIVLSGEESPYAVARDGASKVLTQEGHGVKALQLSQLTKDIKAAMSPKVDVYLAVGTRAAVLLHEQVKPPARLVYCMVAGPDRLGLTQGAPAGGVSTDVPADAQVKLILRAMSGTKTIGMLYRSDAPASEALLKEIQQAVPKDMRLVNVAVDRHPSVAAAIEALLGQKPDIVWTAPDPSVYDTATIRALLLASVRQRIPVFGFSTAFVKAGALLGVGVDPHTQGEQAAAMTLEMLKRPPVSTGSTTKPALGSTAQSPAERPASTTQQAVGGPAGTHAVQPPIFQIAVNLVAAESLSITLPAELIESATHVFKPEGEKP